MIDYEAPVSDILERAAEAIAECARTRARGGLADVISVEAEDTDALVRVAAAHAVHVEFGTSRMAARPFLMPAVETLRGRLSEILL